jgi:hypothetical protein
MKRGFLWLWPNTKHVVAWEYFNLCTSGWIKALIAFWIREKDIFLNPYLSLLYHKARGNKKNYREIYHKDCVH